MKLEPPDRPDRGWTRRVGLVLGSLVIAVATVAAVRWCVAIVHYRSVGLDPSDEAYYLLSASQPGATIARQSNFGFYTGLLLHLGGGSIGMFRVLGMVLLVGVCASVSWVLAGVLPSDVGVRRSSVAVCIMLALTSAATCYYGLWLTTPSYNLLVLVFTLIGAAAMVVVCRSTVTPSGDRRGWRALELPVVVLAATVVLLADIKATAGAAIGVAVLACLAVSGAAARWRSVGASLCAGGVVGLVVNLLVVGSPVETVRTMRRFATAAELGETHSTQLVFETDFLRSDVLPFLGWYVLICLGSFVVHRLVRTPSLRALLAVAGMAFASFALWDERAAGGSQLFGGNGGWWWARMSLFALLFLTFGLDERPPRVWLGPVVSAFALVASVGSNVGFIHTSVLLAGVWMFGVLVHSMVCVRTRADGIALLGPLMVFVGVTAVASFAQVNEALADPYRLGVPIEQSDTPSNVPGFGRVLVTAQMAAYLSELGRLSGDLADDARACLVDLTGGTPVSAIALSASTATTHWMFGAYPGSDAAAEYLVGESDCVKGRVLLIEAPEGDRAIALPASLRGRDTEQVARVPFEGYVIETHVISVVEPSVP